MASNLHTFIHSWAHPPTNIHLLSPSGVSEHRQALKMQICAIQVRLLQWRRNAEKRCFHPK